MGLMGRANVDSRWRSTGAITESGRSPTTIRSISLPVRSEDAAIDPYTNAKTIRDRKGSKASLRTSASPTVFAKIFDNSSKIGEAVSA